MPGISIHLVEHFHLQHLADTLTEGNLHLYTQAVQGLAQGLTTGSLVVLGFECAFNQLGFECAFNQ